MFEAVWSPGYFGVNFAVAVTGSNTTPPPPTSGSPVAAVNHDRPLLRLAA